MPEKIPHSVDGIEEYDNPIPRWLMWLLYITIIISIIYWVMYPGWWSGTTGWTQAKMYQSEVDAAGVLYAEAQKKAGDVTAMIGDSTAIAAGKEIFAQNCMPCHGADATGGIGPNLTDSEWIYGGGPKQIVNTITNGTENGMPPWGSLGAAKVSQVSAYVHSLGGGE